MDACTHKQTAQICALDYLVQRLHAMVYELRGLSSEQIKKEHAALREVARTTPLLEGGDPGIAALVAGEFEDALNGILKALESLLVQTGQLRN